MHDPDELPSRAAGAIRDTFDAYHSDFQAITQRAQQRFAARDAHGAQADAVERLELYSRVIDGRTVPLVRDLLAERVYDRELWARMKRQYAGLIAGRRKCELAETFFNSVTRRIFTTVGVDPQIEFVNSDFDAARVPPGEPAYRTYRPDRTKDGYTQTIISQVLAGVSFSAPFADLQRDAALTAALIDAHLAQAWDDPTYDRIELLKPVFYRGNGAFLIGRICAAGSEEEYCPLALCLLNGPQGSTVDAVLLDEDEVSVLFSFTRSYFHVASDHPYELVAFLKSILPLKRLAELYIAIGYNKHGKTELYRDLIHHLANSADPFHIAPGERGMVMVVFSMDSYDFVFKVIKDKVDYPKNTTRQEVMDRYDLVFRHDRAGRLADAQEFEYLSFDRSRFNDELLAELLDMAPSMVSVQGDCVVVRHLYTERRMTPLNLYVRLADEPAARLAVLDYGQAIKDLAATNIFPGDVLLKNFGVTRHGRVVFYDYDELALLDSVKFRRLPPAGSFEDEYAAEPFFYVGPDDVFPEEFRTFLGLQEPLRSAFIDAHADLFEVQFWQGMQRRHQAGEVVYIYPYAEARRLRED